MENAIPPTQWPVVAHRTQASGGKPQLGKLLSREGSAFRRTAQRTLSCKKAG